jgi:hypothetical protein
MVIYPVIATYYFKTKNIKLKIPVRAKLIHLEKFVCKKCDVKGTISDILKYCEREIDEKGEPNSFGKIYHHEKLGNWAYTNVLGRGDKIPNCPMCFKKTTKEITELIKLYTKRVPYIDIRMAIHNITNFKWKDRFGKFPTSEISAFVETLEDAKKRLVWAREHRSQLKLTKCEVIVKMKKVSMEDLKKANEKSEQIKMEKEI